jgi:exopolysaccharide production protein ExoQ
MGFWLAFLLCILGTAGLFYLEHDRSAGNAKALWLPVMWLWIVGSRPVSAWLAIWFGIGTAAGQGLDAQLDGSPMDAIVFMVLTTAALVVLSRRKRAASLVKSSAPLLLFFLYTLLSCSWSPFPDVAFKRWIKDVGDLAMIIVIATDPEPIAALRRVFSRVGFVLLPASILLIRYTALGRAYDPSGGPMNTGVTTNKNTLGLITFTISLGALWSLLSLLRSKRSRSRKRQLVARATLLAFGIAVLQQAHSATSIACFVLGAFLILATNLAFFRRRPVAVHALVVTILLLGGISMFFGGEATVADALGRDPSLSSRTDIWKAAIPICPNPLIGAGFESFWNGYGKFVTEGLSMYERGLNSAHDGYIEVYLNLGWIGVGFTVVLLISGYRRSCAAFRRNPEVGSLMLAFVATAAIYSITEAGFRILTPTWLFLLLAIVGSRSIASSGSSGTRKPLRGTDNHAINPPAKPQLALVT